MITKIEALLQDGSGPVGNTITQWQTFRIKAYFELPNDTVKAGDTTTVKLPEKLRFNQTLPFQITDAAGNVVANAVVDGENKTIILTYTEYPEKHSDVSGNFFFYVRMDRRVVDGETDIPLDFVINNQVISAGSVHFEGYPTPNGSAVSKSGIQETVANVNGNRAWFQINVNTKGENLTDVSIVDKLKSKGITVDKDSIKIRKGEWKVEKGDIILVNQKDVTNNYTIAFDPDDSGFSINLGNVSSNEGYQIIYYVHSDYELVDGEIIENDVVLHGSNVGDLSACANITWAVAGGSAAGYVYKIKIKKVEKGDDSKVLAGAVFEVKRIANDDVVGTITTNSDGEGELGGLLKDKYELTEITPPDGYERLNTAITVSTDDFGSDKVALKTVENEPAKTSVSVEKRWVGKTGKSATVSLYRKYESNGFVTEEATGLSKELNENNKWKATFENLEKHAPDGSEYEYYVKESPMSGYSSDIQDKGDNNFVITNTYIPPEKPTPPEKTPPTEKSKTTTPKTGDANNIGGFVIMVLVSFGALAAAVLKKKKKEK